MGNLWHPCDFCILSVEKHGNRMNYIGLEQFWCTTSRITYGMHSFRLTLGALGRPEELREAQGSGPPFTRTNSWYFTLKLIKKQNGKLLVSFSCFWVCPGYLRRESQGHPVEISFWRPGETYETRLYSYVSVEKTGTYIRLGRFWCRETRNTLERHCFGTNWCRKQRKLMVFQRFCSISCWSDLIYLSI